MGDSSSDAGADMLPRSRLSFIWASHEAQMSRIDELEKRIDEAVMRKRRRILTLAMEGPVHRRSHLRGFLTHQWDSQDTCKLFIEGRPLIGHLDHESAQKMDELFPPPVDSGDLLDRSQYRGGMSEREGEVPVEPIRFTHFFDKVAIRFQTIHTTAAPARAKKTPPPTVSKKGRKGKRKADDLDYPSTTAQARPLMPAQAPLTELHWSCERNQMLPQVASSDDAHAFIANYSPSPAPQGLEVHSVVATISMWPKRPLEPEEMLYKPSPAFAAVFFPQHTNERVRVVDAKKSPAAKKAKEETGTPGASPVPDIPVEMHSFAPSTLTMGEISTALFLYAQEKSLLDEQEGGALVCDKTLATLLQVDRLNFCDLERLLRSKSLVFPVTTDTDPVELTYILTKDTAVPPPRLDAAAASTAATDEQTDTAASSLHHPALLQFDMDIHIPSLFSFRAREIMRRIKQREYGYTSSRTKARNWLMAARSSDDVARQRIDETVVGDGFSKEHIPIWLALARAAPADSEARASAQMNARTCHLLDKIQGHAQAAQSAWKLVDEITQVEQETSKS